MILPHKVINQDTFVDTSIEEYIILRSHLRSRFFKIKTSQNNMDNTYSTKRLVALHTSAE